MANTQRCAIIKMVMEMTNKRYEMTDEQGERVRVIIIQSRIRRPPRDDSVMLSANTRDGTQPGSVGKIFPSNMAHGKQCIASFVNGGMTGPFCAFLLY